MLNFRDKISYSNLYYWLLLAIAVGLPLSPFLVSASQFALALVWFIEGNYTQKLKKLAGQKALIAFLGIYFIHIAGLLYSSNWSYGLNDLKIKAPLFVIPFILGTTDSLSLKKTQNILLAFTGAVTTGTIISLAFYFGIGTFEYSDIREISRIISHIRFSLQIVLSIQILLYVLWTGRRTLKTYWKIFFCTVAIWLTVFLFILQSLSGIIILFISTFIFILWVVGITKKIPLKIGGIVLLMLLILLTSVSILSTYRDFYTVQPVDRENIEQLTRSGNKYFHDFNNKQLENGNYIGLYICEKELHTVWNLRSNIDFYGKDKKNQNIQYTLMRYLTSKGFRKDADGVNSLNEKDIKFIEQGCTNYRFAGKIGFTKRIYQTIWEVHSFKNGGNPSYSTTIQRYVYTKAALAIIKDHFWRGTGTGDVNTTFQEYYEKTHSQLVPERRKRAHNQFLTFFLSFGVFGFMLILFFMCYPVYRFRNRLSWIFYIFFIIVGLSMLGEDTLETQAGATFFAYFYSFLVFSAFKEVPLFKDSGIFIFKSKTK
ncbi:MAG: O-antigen ligase family protein [Bacteroidales bacterium]|nr:O-antigen ligase family protein [Bacteroidales bacterium]